MGAERFAESVNSGSGKFRTANRLHDEMLDYLRNAPPEKKEPVKPADVDVKPAEAAVKPAEVGAKPAEAPQAPTAEFKNPALFAVLVKSAFTNMDGNRDGNLSLPELKTYAARAGAPDSERGAANLMAAHYSVFAGLAHDERKLTPRDLDRFSEVTQDNVCNTAGRAVGNAVGWALFVGIISAAAGSEQSGLNAAASGTSAALASTIESSILQKGRDSLRSINYFDLKSCR